MKLFKIEKNYNEQTSWDLVDDVFANENGDIFKIKKGELVKLHQDSANKNGAYLSVNLKGSDSKYHNILAHTIVYSAVTLTHMQKGQAIHHKNANKSDNRFSNLEKVTSSENLKKFFNGAKAENRKYAEQQKYRIPKSLLENDVEVWAYNSKYNLDVSSLGRVKKGDNFLIAAQVNNKFKNNKIVAYYKKETKRTSSVTVARLVADTFLITAEKYKTLLKDENAGFKASNLYTVPSKEKMTILP